MRTYFQSTSQWITPRDIIPILRRNGELESVEHFQNRMAKIALRFFVMSNIILALATGVRIGIYTVTFRELYGAHIYQLQAWYFVTALFANIIMGVLADSILGRRRVFLIGCSSFILSYLVHAVGTWHCAVLGEILYGFGEACITGILAAWLRYVLEQQKGTDFKKWYKKASYRAFGFRYISVSLMAITTGQTLPWIGSSTIWNIGAIISVLLLWYVYRRMYWRRIPVPVRKRRKFWPTLRNSITEVMENKIVQNYFILGCVQYAVWSLLGIAWYTSFSHSLPGWLPLLLIAGIATVISSIAGFVAHKSESAKSYELPNIPNRENLSEKQIADITREHQLEIDFRWMRWAHFGGGILVLSVAFVSPETGIILYLAANIARGVFQKKFAGSINQSISEHNKKYSTTIISWFETTGSLARLIMTIVGGAIEQLAKTYGDRINFGLAGIIMIASGVIFGWETIRETRSRMKHHIHTWKQRKRENRERGTEKNNSTEFEDYIE